MSVERLTYRHEDQHGNPTNSISPALKFSYAHREDWVKKVAVRLAAIEDILGGDYDLDRLRALVEADRDGRCVVLWAAPGTKVFEIAKTCSCGGYEEKFKYFPGYSDCVSCCEECDASRAVNERMLLSFELKTPPYGLGKTVFLTREAAESALKGERDEQVP